MRVISAVCTALALMACSASAHSDTYYDTYSYVPSGGYVQTEEMAIAIAEIILDSIYGKEVIDAEKPLTAVLEKGVWTIRGTLPENTLGGTAMIKISRKTGQILRVVHYK